MRSIKLLLYLIGVMALISCQQNSATDYASELARMNAGIQTTEQQLSAARKAGDASQQRNLIHKKTQQIFARASLTANYTHFHAAEKAIQAALAIYPDSQGLYLLRANFNFKMHRLAAAEQDLQHLDNISAGKEIRILKADIEFQRGQYEQAAEHYQQILGDFKTWDNLARVAYYTVKMGKPDEARTIYVEAQNQLSVKEMRFFAWLELQRGLIDLEYGRYADALVHYQQANRGYSGYWLIEEHIAEILSLLGRTEESVGLYRSIIEKTGNPEFMGALAKILDKTNPVEAGQLRRQAEAAYAQQASLYPEAVSGHIIQYWLGQEKADPKLLAYAEENLRLRPNAESRLLLLQTHQKLNQPEVARRLMREILQTPWRTPEVERLAKELECNGVHGCSMPSST